MTIKEMFQVSFSQSSSDFFKSLPQSTQIELIEALGKLTPTILDQAQEPLARFKSHEMTYYRYRFEDLRLYFTLQQNNIRCELILNKNTWTDFKVRSGLQSASDHDIETSHELVEQIKK